jgi:hypothetical protein
MTHWRALIGIASIFLTGCASIVHGPNQDLTVTSQPEALCVTINGEPYGATPVVASLPRGATYLVQIRKDSYMPYEMTVIPVMSQMIWGNLLLGGLIGMAVDGATNAAFEHQPNRVHAYFPVPVEQTSKPADCPESVVILEARRKAAEKAMFVKSGLTPYEPQMSH